MLTESGSGATSSEREAEAVARLVNRSRPNAPDAIKWNKIGVSSHDSFIPFWTERRNSFEALVQIREENWRVVVSEVRLIPKNQSGLYAAFGVPPTFRADIFDAEGKFNGTLKNSVVLKHLYEAADRQNQPSEKFIDALLADSS